MPAHDGPGAQIQLVGWTEFQPPDSTPFVSDATGAQALPEFAGRACYRSWDRPRAATATNAGYLRHLIEVGHLSVLEHSSATFYLTGISRAAAGEILRHRHFSGTELSPRHEPAAAVAESAIPSEADLRDAFLAATNAMAEIREEFRSRTGASSGLPGKQLRQLVSRLLPGAVPTDLVLTGNFRAYRHFVGMRATDPADAELRGIAVQILRHLQRLAPNVFADFRISKMADGSELAASPFVDRS